MDYTPARSPEPIKVGRTDCPLVVLRSHPNFPNTLSEGVEAAWTSTNPAWPDETIKWILARLEPPCHADWEASKSVNKETRDGLEAVVIYVRPGKEE
jgi:hypothetical protein